MYFGVYRGLFFLYRNAFKVSPNLVEINNKHTAKQRRTKDKLVQSLIHIYIYVLVFEVSFFFKV